MSTKVNLEWTSYVVCALFFQEPSHMTCGKESLSLLGFLLTPGMNLCITLTSLSLMLYLSLGFKCSFCKDKCRWKYFYSLHIWRMIILLLQVMVPLQIFGSGVDHRCCTVSLPMGHPTSPLIWSEQFNQMLGSSLSYVSRPRASTPNILISTHFGLSLKVQRTFMFVSKMWLVTLINALKPNTSLDVPVTITNQ